MSLVDIGLGGRRIHSIRHVRLLDSDQLADDPAVPVNQ
jgi:hypothetical protein